MLISCSKLPAAQVVPLRCTESGHKDQTESVYEPLCSSEKSVIHALILEKISLLFTPFFKVYQNVDTI